MGDARKREDWPKAKLLPFIIVWVLGCFLAFWLCTLLLAVLENLEGLDGLGYLLILNLGIFTATSTVQFFLIRRFLHVELRGWVPLSIAGVLAGIVVLKLLEELTTFDPMQKLAAAVTFTLLWGMPAMFQWILLRKRFVNHGLWLLAAMVMGPLFSYVFIHNDGIVQSLFPDSNWMIQRSAILAADFALPSIVLGLILYVVVKRGGRADALNHAVE